MLSSRGSSQCRDRTQVSHTAGVAPAASTSRRLPRGSQGLTQPPRSTARPASPGAGRLGRNKLANTPGDLPRCLHSFLSGTRRP